MLEKIQQVRQQHKMRLSFHPVVSQLTLLSFALLCPVTSYPVSSTVPLPAMDGPKLQSALLHLHAALEDPGDAGLTQAAWPQDPQEILREPGDNADGSWEKEALLRAQRGDLTDQLLSPFPGGHLTESVHYQGGEGNEGGKRNEALTSIAGGLQAVSREKGGFGFRFGRKRWTDRGSGSDQGRSF